MKKYFLLWLVLASLDLHAQNWQSWINLGDGIEVSFAYGKTKCNMGNTRIRFRNVSQKTYTKVRVSFQTNCEGGEVGASAYNLTPGKIDEDHGNWYTTNLNVSNLHLTQLETKDSSEKRHVQNGMIDEDDRNEQSDKKKEYLSDYKFSYEKDETPKNTKSSTADKTTEDEAENEKIAKKESEETKSSSSNYQTPVDPRITKSNYVHEQAQKNNDAFVNATGQAIQLMGQGIDNQSSYQEHYQKRFNRFGFDFGLAVEVLPVVLDYEFNYQYNGQNRHTLNSLSESAFLGSVTLGASYYPIYSKYVRLALNGRVDGGMPVGVSGYYVGYNVGGNLAIGTKSLKAIGEYIYGQQFLTYENYSAGLDMDYSYSGAMTPKRTSLRAGLRFSWVAHWVMKDVGAHFDLMYIKDDPQVSPLLVTTKKNFGIHTSLHFDSRYSFFIETIFNYPVLGDIYHPLDDDFKANRTLVKFGAVRKFVF